MHDEHGDLRARDHAHPQGRRLGPGGVQSRRQRRAEDLAPRGGNEEHSADPGGGFDEGLGVCIGHEYWLRVSTRYAFGLIDEPLALRRWSETSLTRGNRSRARKTKAFVLRRFYHDRGGAEMLATKPAHRRLAKVCLQAGRILLKQGQFVEARQHLAAAIGYRRGYLKAWPLYLAAATLSLGR